MVDNLFLDALHRNEGVGKDLLHAPAVGVELRVVAAGNTGVPNMIDVEAISDGLHTLSMEESHCGEEVVLGAS